VERVRIALRAGAATGAEDPATCTIPKDPHRRTILHLAAASADMSPSPAGADVVRALLQGGANASCTDATGETPLTLAVATDQSTVVVELLNAGSPVDAQDVDGSTPLHGAARVGARNSAQVLLAHGAPTDVTDAKGFTPLDYAKRRGFRSVANAIVMAEAARARDDASSPVDDSPRAPPYEAPQATAPPDTEDTGSLNIIGATIGVLVGALVALALACVIRHVWSRPSKSIVGSLKLKESDSEQIKESSPGRQQKSKPRPQELQEVSGPPWPPGRVEALSAEGIDNTDVHSPLCADSGCEGRAEGQLSTRSPPVNVQAPFRTSSGRLPLARSTPPPATWTNENSYRSRSPKSVDARKEKPRGTPQATREVGIASTRANRDLRRAATAAAAAQDAQNPAPPRIYGAQRPRPI